MKLLTRLRKPLRNETSSTHPAQPSLEAMIEVKPEAPNPSFDGMPGAELLNDYDYFGIGAAMPHDVAGLDFLDSYRKRIPDMHEEFPLRGMACGDMHLAERDTGKP